MQLVKPSKCLRSSFLKAFLQAYGRVVCHAACMESVADESYPTAQTFC